MSASMQTYVTYPLNKTDDDWFQIAGRMSFRLMKFCVCSVKYALVVYAEIRLRLASWLPVLRSSVEFIQPYASL